MTRGETNQNVNHSKLRKKTPFLAHLTNVKSTKPTQGGTAGNRAKLNGKISR